MQQMYATSKLIIPPKPARDTPFIPKLRIRLRPSPTHDSVNSDCEIDFGTVQFDEECMSSDISSDVLGMPLVSGVCSDVSNGKLDLPKGASSGCNVDNNSGKLQSKCFKRTVSKRKSSSLLNDLDMHSPESVLTKVNLKTLINRETFFSFPLDVQQMLSNLLPLFDHDKESWSNCSSSSSAPNDSELCDTGNVGELDSKPNSVWLHPTALNNEFFTKALKDFSDRQARGELTPRVRNRAGLRTHVGNRCRYTPFDDASLGDFDVGVEDENSSTAPKKSSNGSTNSRNRTRRSSRSKTKSSAQGSCDIPESSEVLQTDPSDSGRSQSSKKLISTSISSLPESLESKKVRRTSLRVASNCSNKNTPDPRNGKHPSSSLSSSYLERNEKDESVGLEDSINDEMKMSPTSESYLFSVCSSMNTDPMDSSKPMELEESRSRSSEGSANGNLNNNGSINSSMDNNQDNNHYLPSSPCDSTLPDSGTSTPPLSTTEINKLLMFEKNSDDIDTSQLETATQERNPNLQKSKQNHPRRLSLDSKFSTSPNGKQVSPTSQSRGRPQRSGVVGSDGIASPSMPPPRQTKTLAAMREKLRAKRLMKESERGISGQPYYGLPGSMTPHPASGSSGYFRQPKNYPSQDNFSPFRDKMDRQSSSVLSSPNNYNTSPFMNERQAQSSQSMNLSTLLNDNYESSTTNLISGSPCSPYSAPSVEIMSPLITFNCHSTESYSSGGSNETVSRSLASSNLKCYTSPQRLVSVSDCSINNLPSVSSCSPDSFISGQVKLHEQSASAPSTPLTPMSGQNMSSCRSLPNPQPTGPFTTNTANSTTVPWTSINQSPSVLSPKSMEITANQSNKLVSKTTSPGCLTLQTPLDSDSSDSIPKDSQTAVKLAVPSSATSSSAASLLLSQSGSKPTSSSDKPTAIPLSSTSAVTKLLTAAGQNRPSTTTRAFFVDGDNLPEAVAFLQSLNPKATITQQQFLLIPTANKSRMFLCRAPATNASDVVASLGPRASNSNSTKTEPISVAAVLQTPNQSATTPGPEMKVAAPTSVVADIQPSVTSAKPNYIGPTSESRSSSDLDDLNTTELAKCLSDAQVSRSLVYSNSVNTMQNGTSVSAPVFKPLVKQVEHPHDRPNIIQTMKRSLPKVAISSSTSMMNYPPRPTMPLSVAQNTKQPVQHPQLTISLLGSSPPAVNHDVPVVLFQDRNQHPVRPQPVSLPSNVGWIHSGPFDQHLPTHERLSSNFPILPSPTVITAHTAPNTNDLRRVQQSVVQPISSAQLQNHANFNNNNTYNSNGNNNPHFGVQSFHSSQSSFPNPGVSTSFLSAPTATIIPPCLPAVILSHPLNIQSSSPTVSTNPSIFTRSLQ